MTEFFKLQIKLDQAFHKVLNEIGIETGGYYFRVDEGSIECMLLKEGSQEEIEFGGSVYINARRNWDTEKSSVKINKGSMGQFDLSCRASVKSTLLMADFIKNFKALEKWSCIFCNKVESFNNLKN